MQIELAHNFIIRIPSILSLWALFRSKLFIILEMSSVEKLIESSDLLVRFARLLCKTLLLFKKVYWLAKKVLKSSSFSLKFGINLFSWNRGGIKELFLLFREVFKIDQYIFELVTGLALREKCPYSELLCPYFPAFGLNMDQKNSEYGHFLRNLAIDFYILTKSITSCNKKLLQISLNTQQRIVIFTDEDCNLHILVLLISRNMNYPRRNLSYLKQVYNFQCNQIKFENPKSSLSLKRFIVRLLTTLNPRKPKVR